MKLSRYNYIYKRGSHCIVFNTYSNSISILDSTEEEMLQNPNTISLEQQQAFQSAGILIDDEIDELAMMRYDNAFYAFNGDYHVRILTTTGCNAKCIYCYEAGTPVVSMDSQTVEKVISFMRKTLDPARRIHLEWFGGEPLVNMPVITDICRRMAASGFTFTSSIITNGILLDRENIKELKETCRLTKAQITLDGVAAVYSYMKQVPQACFSKVLDNIRQLADMEITVYIRMNYKNNKQELTELIQFLKAHFGFNRRIFYYVYPVFGEDKTVSREIMEDILDLNDALIENGLMKKTDLYQFPYRQTRCFATSNTGFTIAPDGTLFNCSHVMNACGEVGTVENYSPYHPNRIRFTDQTIASQCAECVLYPLCKGGCRAAELGDAKLNQCVTYKSCIDLVLNRILTNPGKEV